MTNVRQTSLMDDIDRRIIKATEAGLALCPRPYHALAENLGLSADDVMERMRRMLDSGVIRRIACVPNHYRLGYSANGMSVWDVPDSVSRRPGERSGRLILSATVTTDRAICRTGRSTCSPWCMVATAAK